MNFAGGVIPFYKKRFIGIIPSYWCVGILFTLYKVAHYFFSGSNLLGDFLYTSFFLMPIETFGLQSAFCTLFPFSHNGGTWFVSCLAFCYLLFPLFKIIVSELTAKSKVLVLIVLSGLLLYSSLVPHICNTSNIYTNLTFRGFEFFIGVLLASGVSHSKFKPVLGSWFAFAVECFVLILGVTISRILGIPCDYMLLNWIALPCFIAMVVTLSHLPSNIFLESRFMSYACEVSYMFFFAQFFLWIPVRVGLQYVGLWNHNLVKITVSFVLCAIIAVVLHEWVEKPAKRIAKKMIN